VRARDGRPPPSALGFYARRVRRIVPAYYVQLAVLFALVLPLLRGIHYWRSDLYVYLYNAFAHALFLHNTTPLSSGSMEVNGALWTLAVEAQFYLLMPLLVPLFVRWTHAAFAAFVALAVLWHVGVAAGLDGLVAAQMSLGAHWGWPESIVRYLLLHQLPSYLAHFAVGIVLGRAWLAWRAQHQASIENRLLNIAATCALAVLYWSIAIDGRTLGDLHWIVAPACLGVLLFRAVTTEWEPARRVLSGGPLAFAGRVSYSAYLYHLPLLLVWNARVAPQPSWASLPLYFGALGAISWLSWRFIEQPFLNASPPRAR